MRSLRIPAQQERPLQTAQEGILMERLFSSTPIRQGKSEALLPKSGERFALSTVSV